MGLLEFSTLSDVHTEPLAFCQLQFRFFYQDTGSLDNFWSGKLRHPVFTCLSSLGRQQSALYSRLSFGSRRVVEFLVYSAFYFQDRMVTSKLLTCRTGYQKSLLVILLCGQSLRTIVVEFCYSKCSVSPDSLLKMQKLRLYPGSTEIRNCHLTRSPDDSLAHQSLRITALEQYFLPWLHIRIMYRAF